MFPDLDLEFQIMTVLENHPALAPTYPLNLMVRPQNRRWGKLYDKYGGMNLLMHLYKLEEEGFVGRNESLLKYVLTDEGDGFLDRVAHEGGWNTVKRAAEKRPVRLLMPEIWRWLSSGDSLKGEANVTN